MDMTLIDLLKSPHWAKVHQLIWEKLKARNISEIDLPDDAEDLLAVYKEVVDTDKVRMTQQTFTTLVGISYSTFLEHKYTKSFS